MGNKDLFLSQAGLEKLKKEEGVIDGLYDDPSGFCTFGVGHLVDHGHKWPCFLLRAASGDQIWEKNILKMWPGNPYETPYLTHGTAFTDKFDELKANAIDVAKPIVANKKYNKSLNNLSSSQREAVDRVATTAVDQQGRILAKTPDDVLKEDVIPFEKTVRSTISETLTQDEFDALVSFCFNVARKTSRGRGSPKL